MNREDTHPLGDCAQIHDNAAYADVMDTVRRAVEWTENTPEAWAEMKRIALAEVDAQRNFSFRMCAESVRMKDYATNDGSKFSIPNTYIAIFARMFVKEHPEARQYITLCASRFDGII
jgi:hypothetical protein